MERHEGAGRVRRGLGRAGITGSHMAEVNLLSSLAPHPLCPRLNLKLTHVYCNCGSHESSYRQPCYYNHHCQRHHFIITTSHHKDAEKINCKSRISPNQGRVYASRQQQ